MRYIILFLFSICFTPNIHAQIYEVGFFLGNSNFIGDVGSTKYISPIRPAAGLMARWNRSPRHSFRASIIFTELEGDDLRSDDPRRVARGYKFKNNLMEFSGGMEFTFWDFDTHQPGQQFTPYLYSGISAAKYKNSFFRNGVQVPENTYSWAIGIPMVLGIKSSIVDGLILGAEVGVRYTFSDEIDGSVPDTPSRKEPYSFGNLNSNDWYVFSGITLTYTFGEKPCYCVY
ncbi:hypothetical protein BXY82_1235 [Gelidibacter sediminis]|uniref:DUF6089 domain-containing protein n=1 Tax=Gelidibacter sediminis TaxID=1608710 RepID=A0A4V3F9D5_9FLAO|nr:DUF6089 family protein [Gelidibacter sediminis]TDU43816.1 hypothetical protein BXY82_1235 [Gelidibacter sediminis]